MEMTPEKWRFASDYIRDLFGTEDEVLGGVIPAAREAGLPVFMAVSPEVGRLLSILAATTRGSCALEVGTLVGYSGIWIARGLSPTGRLVTIEKDPAHAEFATAQFIRAGYADRVDLRTGPALEVLPGVAAELGPRSVDFAFIDADKLEYPEYFRLVQPLIAPGGLFVADNALGAGDSWIDDTVDAGRRAADAMNRLAASDPDFESVIVPLGSGLLLARRSGPGARA